MLVLIRGAGDIATGIAMRLWRAGVQVVMTDLPQPTAIRRTVCFSQAIVLGETQVEDATARRAEDILQARRICAAGEISVLADPELRCREELRPDALVDAILAKRNLGTRITDAPVVVGVGPGFTAGEDCHAVVETMRGHTLGRVIYRGSALPNTSIPGLVGGFAGGAGAACSGRRHPAPTGGYRGHGCRGGRGGYGGGSAHALHHQRCAAGILSDGTPVFRGMKAGDVDPRGKREYCDTVSDKALAVGGGVLEAVLALSGKLKEEP